MKRLIVALLVGGSLFAVVAFAAASLNVNPGNLSQGQGDVTSCSAKVDLTYVTAGADPVKVTHVKVNTNTTNDCVGAVATVELLDASSPHVFKGVGSCTIPVVTGKCTADIVPDVDVDLVDRARVTLTGP